MAKLILNAYPATRNGAFLSLDLCLGGNRPFPSRTVEIKTLADCVAAFETYKTDAAATGLALAVSMIMGRGDRKPPGFNKLRAVNHYETVNI